jgi:hypothetical protein
VHDDTVPIYDTVEMEPVEKIFFEKWGLWLTGLALVFVLTVGVMATVVGGHRCCSKSSGPDNGAPPFSVASPTGRRTHG